MFITLAWRNLWRNRNRTLITMAAVFFAVLLSVLTTSFQDGIFGNLIKNVVSYYSGYVQVHKNGYWNEKIIDNAFTVTDELIKKIESDENVKLISPRLESFALISSGEKTQGGLVVGIDAEREKQIIHLDKKIKQGSYLTDENNAAIIGEGIGTKLQVKLNDTIIVLGQGYHGATAAGQFVVKGILKFGSPELNNKAMFIHIKNANELLGTENMASAFAIEMNNEMMMDETRNRISKLTGNDYEVMTWKEMMPEIEQHIETDTASTMIIIGILYLLVSFGIFSTLLMLMAERQYELGMLLAIGMSRMRIALMLFFEALITSFTGCIVGVAISIPVVSYFNLHPIRVGGDLAATYEKFGFEPIFPTSVDPDIFINQGIIVLVISMVLFMYPLVKIKSMKAVNAMRK